MGEEEATGARIPSACFGPQARCVLNKAGYENVLLDIASMDVAHSLPDSAASVAVRIAVRGAALLSLDAGFERLWLAQPLVEVLDDPHLFGKASQAGFTVEDLGLVGRIEPIILEQAGASDPDIPRVLQTAVLRMLETDESRPLTAAQQAFAEELSAGVTAFREERKPLVVTVNPVNDVFSDDIFLFSEGDLPGFLRPKVSNLPSALRSIVPSADVAAALADADSLDDASRMRIGTALVTGDGAPRSIKAGARLLLPVDTKWSGRAAVTLAKAHQSAGRIEDACRMALVAMASGERGGAAVADELELRMPLVVIMAVQDEVSGGWPGTAGFETAIYAAVADGDVRAIAGRARAAATGRSVPRSFGSACMLAALTAAAGDHGAAGLRDRLERRFGGDAHWRPAPGKASDEAMAFWIDGGTGAAVLAVAASVGSWCPDGMTFAELSFTRENGKTASICENAGSSDLTHCCGVLGKPPELECRGPIEGTCG